MPETILGREVTTSNPDNYFETLVGEGKKYSTQEELAKANFHGTLHIKELTEKLDNFRGERETLNEVITELRSNNERGGQEPVTPQRDNAVNADNQLELQKTVETAVSSVLTTKEREQREAVNLGLALQKLTTLYGSEQAALAAIRNFQGENHIRQDMVDNLGKSDPDALVILIKGAQPVKQVSPNTPGMDGGETGAALPNTAGLPITWSEATRIRQEQPRVYKTAEFRRKLEQAAVMAEQLGVDFYST